VGGDTFDFVTDRDELHLSMTDAMGHTVEAAVLATVLVGGLRNARRAGTDLVEQVRLADAALSDFADAGQFVTGQVVRVDLGTGAAHIVNAGHPAPRRLRDGQITPLELYVDPPFGTVPAHEYVPQSLALEPGDRLIFLTDGVTERRAETVDLDAVILEGAAMHPREAVQHVVAAILQSTGGELQDDATVMCLDWHGGPSQQRTTESGADVDR
jgi:serine phosphatase RsbU (regulator of sigma subunit)